LQLHNRGMRRTLLLAVRLLLALACTAPASMAWALRAGEPAPPLVLLDRSGELVSLEKLRGRPVYVDFWASWCGPCRQSFSVMNDLHARYAGQGLAVVAVNVDKSRADAERFLKQVAAPFPVVFDAAGITPQAWGVAGMPTAFLVDPQGRIVQIETGALEDRKAAVEGRIRALLAH
jgi:thiol-disulfide isomerase/thioredoxin